MTITLRTDKNSALTHQELDGNFTDLDTRLTTTEGEVNTLQTDVSTLQTDVSTLQTDVAATPNVTDGTANLDVSSIIITSSSTEVRPIIAEAINDSISSVAKFIRNGGTGGTKSALVAETEYTVNVTQGMGSGLWTQISATDETDIYIGGVQGELKSWTDSNNFTSEFGLYTYNKVGGTQSLPKIIGASTDEVIFTNTDQVTVDASHLQLKPVPYADLPTLAAGNADNGKMAFLTTDGASNSQNKLIVSVGGSWVYVDNPSTTVASS